MKHRLVRLLLLLCMPALVLAQDVPLFTKDFTPAEFAQRRSQVYAAIGNGLALLQGAPSPAGYTRFRQWNDFYYLCGIEVPHAYLLLDGMTKTASLYLLHRNDARERFEGKLLSAADADLIKSLSGIDAVYPIDMLAEHLGRFMQRRPDRTVYVPFQPPEGIATSRDLAVRQNTDAASDPWDGGIGRSDRFIQLLKDRFPLFEVRDLSPTLDGLRLIKSPAEIRMIRRATRLAGLGLIESMKATKPGIMEFELDAVAKYVFYRNGAQGEAYFSLVQSGPNAMFPHYNANKRKMQDGDFLLMDFAPDVGYYMSDVTRNWPVNGRFNSTQKEVYSFYLGCYNAILDAIRPGVTAQIIKKEAVQQMESLLSRTRFSKAIYEKGARDFVESYKRGAGSPYTSLGHWVGMATHDVGPYGGPLKPGMVFTIEPALRVPEENINIRLEDMIVITEKGKDILSSFVPSEPDAIEKTMRGNGMLQDYPGDNTW